MRALRHFGPSPRPGQPSARLHCSAEAAAVQAQCHTFMQGCGVPRPVRIPSRWIAPAESQLTAPADRSQVFDTGLLAPEALHELGHVHHRRDWRFPLLVRHHTSPWSKNVIPNKYHTYEPESSRDSVTGIPRYRQARCPARSCPLSPTDQGTPARAQTNARAWHLRGAGCPTLCEYAKDGAPDEYLGAGDCSLTREHCHTPKTVPDFLSS